MMLFIYESEIMIYKFMVDFEDILSFISDNEDLFGFECVVYEVFFNNVQVIDNFFIVLVVVGEGNLNILLLVGEGCFE